MKLYKSNSTEKFPLDDLKKIKIGYGGTPIRLYFSSYLDPQIYGKNYRTVEISLLTPPFFLYFQFLNTQKITILENFINFLFYNLIRCHTLRNIFFGLFGRSNIENIIKL